MVDGSRTGISETAAPSAKDRLRGLDLARFIAFAGMVCVNFFVVMSSDEADAGAGALFISWISGRAAASFVVLAGIGFGLAAARQPLRVLTAITFRRSAFLMALGLANALIFQADILHYYAIYFLIGLMFVQAPPVVLKAAILALPLIFFVLVFNFDFDAGWDWEAYAYTDFWQPAGFFRNLVFNGWHPIIPWAAFFLFGMMLSKKPLSDPRFQTRLMVGGAGAMIVAASLSALLSAWAGDAVEDLGVLFATDPVPPVPLYMLAGSGAASLVTGFSLRIAPWLMQNGLLDIFARAGRQTLTLYIAHIFIGMSLIDMVGLLGGQSGETAVAAALLFCIAAIFYAKAWQRVAHRGPIETLMRKLTG